MVLSLIFIIFVAGIAYFHWIQGVFSASISMALAIVAATISLGYYESVATGLLGGAMADYANGLILCALFAAVYGVGRVLFDMFVPGNVRVPLYFDKVGGLVCGAIAGVCAAGVAAIATQSMPFGPTIVTFSRYPIAEERDVAVDNGSGRQIDAVTLHMLEIEGAGPKPQPEQRNSLLLGVDSMVADFVAFQSRAGAFAGGRRFDLDHPNFLDELFFGRVGIEPGAKRTALNIAGKTEVNVVELFAPPSLLQADGEVVAIRKRELPRQLVADPRGGPLQLVVRINPDRGALEKDGKFRFSPGVIRLVANGKEYHPIGTMHYPGNVVVANLIDDYLIGSGSGPIDLVFQLDRADVADEGEAGALKIKPGVYLEVKRYARTDLSDKAVAIRMPDAQNHMERKPSLVVEIAKQIAEAGAR